MVRSGVVKQLTILGSTGSIGKSTLAIVDACPDEFSVMALVAGSNWKLLSEQALVYRPAIVGIADESSLEPLRTALAGSGIEVVSGEGACAAIAATPVDLVVAGIVGLAGLPAVLVAVEAGQTVALANKESLVSAGGLVTSRARQHGARLIPVDSEHSAVFQCWMGWAHVGAKISEHNSAICDASDRASIRHICLTASGGPFRDTPLEDFTTITPATAIKHPNWSMGPKISIDSATMMNKGLEVIEAAWLFNQPPSSIDVLVHPQVAIHGMVYFNDGSVIAQMGTADMKPPISYALAWPVSVLPTLGSDFHQPVNQIAWWVIDTLFSPVFAILLAVLTGAWLGALDQVSAPAGGQQWGRLGWLLLLGLVHAYLFWFGDLLAVYAIAGMIAAAGARLRLVTQIGLGGGLVVMTVLVLAGGAALGGLTGDTVTPETALGFPPERVAALTETYRSGFLARWPANMGFAVMQELILIVFLGGGIIGAMLLGMAAWRTGFFGPDWSMQDYVMSGMVALGIGLPLSGWASLQALSTGFAPSGLFATSLAGMAGSLCLVFGIPAMVLLACKAGVLRPATEALARHALETKGFSVPLFHTLMQACGLSADVLYRHYVGKNVLNFFRQDHGYQDGTYIKEWQGREDNEHLSELLESLDATAAGFPEAVYEGLASRYADVT